MKRSLKLIILSVALTSCHHPVTLNNAHADKEQTNMHISYDDSTLNNRVLPIMMPYNRIIDPAGKVIKFGDPRLENHSLDAKLIPQTNLTVTELR
jgi:hypothetical protein